MHTRMICLHLFKLDGWTSRIDFQTGMTEKKHQVRIKNTQLEFPMATFQIWTTEFGKNLAFAIEATFLLLLMSSHIKLIQNVLRIGIFLPLRSTFHGLFGLMQFPPDLRRVFPAAASPLI